MLTVKDIAEMIDHSLLKPNLSDQDVVDGCRIAKQYGVASVCVRPTDLPTAKKELEGSGVLLTTVIGFPHGSNRTDVKVFEARQAIADGAVEIDMVLNIGKLISGEYDYVENEIRAIVEEAHKSGALAKVIFENCYLTDEQKEKACVLSERAGADFVKTSTGFGTSGATPSDLRLMRKTCGPKVRLKAAGGVRTLDDALVVKKLCGNGARFGATASKVIMDEAIAREKAGTLAELPDGAEMKIGNAH